VIIAIDGPAGSGKSSTAREVARRLGFLHVDSGAFYRALTLALLDADVPEAAWEELDPERLDALEVRGERREEGLRMMVGDRAVGRELRGDEVNAHVSHVARIPGVRAWLLGRLRALGRAEDVVVDGRDIGTAVFPDATLKVFLVAAPEVRARRRLKEEGVAEPDRETLLQAIDRLRERDRIDSEREVAPLVAAEDAVRVDTTSLAFEEQVDAILELARGARQGSGRRPPPV
jgi:cytidylate kinase